MGHSLAPHEQSVDFLQRLGYTSAYMNQGVSLTGGHLFTPGGGPGHPWDLPTAPLSMPVSAPPGEGPSRPPLVMRAEGVSVLP